MYFSSYSTSPKTPYSSTSSYDSPTPSTTVSSNPAAACAYPSWPRRPSLSSNSSSKSVSFVRHIPTNYISDDELFLDDDQITSKALGISGAELPVSSPVGSVPSMERGASFSSMSQRDLVRRLRGQEMKVEAALAAQRAQRRKKVAKLGKGSS